MTTDTLATDPPITTTLGTPASPKWDLEWMAGVEQLECELGHRICGAHTPAWTPCRLVSTHANGRCRFHGGAPGIGAPGGNRNAWIHGLYSRRLQQCGDHCPLWDHCPMAGKDVVALPARERPYCVYEREEYEALLDALPLGGMGQPTANKPEPKETNCEPTPDPFDEPNTSGSPDWTDSPNSSISPTPSIPSIKSIPPDPSHTSHSSHHSHISPLRDSASPREPNLIEHNIALFQVLLTRAQAALGIARLTDETRATSPNTNYHLHTTRIGALVQAQLHIARELRHWLKLLPGFTSTPWRGRPARETSTPKPPASKTPPKPEPSGLPMRMMKVLEETEGFLEIALGLPPGVKSPFSPRLPKRNPPPDAPPLPV